MDLHIKTIVLGPLETNCHVLWNQNTCWVVDVGMWPNPLVDFLETEDLQPERIVLTHGHGDHIGGVGYLMEKYPQTRLLCPRGDVEMLSSPERNLSATLLMGITAPPPHELLDPDTEIPMGSHRWRTLDTSGHTPGGMSFYEPTEGVVLTGDTLFAGGIGRTNIPSGDMDQLMQNIREQLLTLPDETRVLPGHGPETTIGQEKAVNPFLR